MFSPSAGSFGSHTYRDLPFVLIPVFWNAISGGGRRADTGEVERAHGDGMIIGYDSHEAFEEVLWRAYWPHKYLEDRILTWAADERDSHDEFAGFFGSHVRKLLLLRGAGRYVSKNNANVSRIPKLLATFPDAQVVVPFRRPFNQAVSMWRQHCNFVKIHKEEPFTRRYMEDLGHYDFGANLRPVDFGDWLDGEPPGSTDGVEFWLLYWCTAFESLLEERSSRVTFVDYDRLCDHPAPGLSSLREMLEIEDLDVPSAAAKFRPSNSYDLAEMKLPEQLLGRSATVLSELERVAIN